MGGQAHPALISLALPRAGRNEKSVHDVTADTAPPRHLMIVNDRSSDVTPNARARERCLKRLFALCDQLILLDLYEYWKDGVPTGKRQRHAERRRFPWFFRFVVRSFVTPFCNIPNDFNRAQIAEALRLAR